MPPSPVMLAIDVVLGALIGPPGTAAETIIAPRQIPGHPGVALDRMSQDKTTFPPFSPARVLEQRRYRRIAPDVGVRDDRGAPVHPRHRGHSARNLHRRVATEVPGGAFVWFSSNSAFNQRGSVMTYVAHGDDVTRWYASFLGNRGWRLGQVKGVARASIEALLAKHPSTDRD